MGMNPTISLVIKVEVATKVAAVAGVATADGDATMVGLCRPMGILGQLRLQVSPHHCGSNEEIGLMDHH